MKVLGLSGGSTKGIGTLGVCEELSKKGIEWDRIVGTSVGAILSVPIAMKKFDEASDVFLNLKVKDMFNVSPLTKKGKFNIFSIFYLLKNKLAIGDMSNVKKLIKSIITEEVFEEYKKGDYAECYVVSVDLNSGSVVSVNVKEVSYKDYLEYTLASSSIPVFTMPVMIGDHVLYDGGVRDHVANHTLMQDVTECWTIFTRPEKVQLGNWKPKGIVDVLQRTIDVMNLEISKNDELKINTICDRKSIPNYKIYLPNILESLYDTDNNRLLELYEKGKEIGKNFNKFTKTI